jgi:hypothetical protein
MGRLIDTIHTEPNFLDSKLMSGYVVLEHLLECNRGYRCRVGRQLGEPLLVGSVPQIDSAVTTAGSESTYNNTMQQQYLLKLIRIQASSLVTSIIDYT